MIFEKLSVVNQSKKQYFENSLPVVDNETIEPGWVRYPDAHYNLVENNIPIFLEGIHLHRIESDPERSNGKPSKKDILSKLGLQADKKHEPTALLSINELPALLYEFLFNGKNGDEIEEMIRKKINEQIRTIRSLTPDVFDKKSIPKNWKKVNSAPDSTNLEKLKRDIDKEVELTNSKLKEVKEILEAVVDRVSEGKKNVSSKPILNTKQRGEISTWLADDIKRFASVAVRQEWKGYQHSELQAMLASYWIKKEDIVSLLEKEIGLKITNEHFMLQEALKEKTLEEFYQTYLRKRRNKLEKLSKQITESDFSSIEEKVFTIFPKRIYHTAPSPERYVQRLLERPINLPRGIFDVGKFSEGREINMQPWFQKAHEADLQKFYSYPRVYDANGKKISSLNQNLALLKTDGRDDIAVIIKNEKRIRQISRQDFYISEMGKWILNKIHNGTWEFSLKDVFLTKAEKRDIQVKAAEQYARSAGDKTENRLDESHILSKRVEISLFGGKIKDRVALKDIGKFRKLEKDAIVKELVSYNNRIWDRNSIEKEIENYESVRKEKLFKAIHNLELEILTQARAQFSDMGHPAELEHNGNPNFKCYMAYCNFDDAKQRESFKKSNFELETSFWEVIAWDSPKATEAAIKTFVRNKFVHSQLPNKSVFDKMNEYFPKTEDERIGDYLLRVFCSPFPSLI